MDNKEPIIDNIILDNSVVIEISEKESESVLFSSLQADVSPLYPHQVNLSGIDYPQSYSPKCAICNSPHRVLLEHVYLDSGKNINAVLNFFKRYYNARLNWPQVSLHIKRHCDLNNISTPGLLTYEDREKELGKWKYREHELALTAILVEIDDVRGMSCRTPDEILKRASMIEKLTRQLMLIKEKRDEMSLGLPNVFEVLFELHEKMVNEDDKRIIRQRTKELHQTIN